VTEFLMTDAWAFLSIIEEGSFVAAAKKCCISASVISKRLTRLERHLGTQLLQRTTRSIALTETGQIFYDKCKRIRMDIMDAASHVLKYHQKPAGFLRINAPMSFGQVHLIPAITDFMKKNPDTQVELILGSQYASFIHNGLDLAIFIKDLPNTHLLKSRKIALRSTGVYGSPHYFEKNNLPKIPEDLINHNCLIYQSEPGSSFVLGQKTEWVFYRDGHKLRIPVSGTLKINSSQALVKAAVSGIGLIKLSSFMVTEEVKNNSLINVLTEYNIRDIDIHAAYPTQHYLPQKVKLFIDFLAERFGSREYWD